MARDIFHQAVKTALSKAGWLVTHDPFPLSLVIPVLKLILAQNSFWLLNAKKN
jgi:XisH protein